MSKILGIDWGEKRIGIAISDELKIIARPFTVLKNNDFSGLKKILNDEKIEKIIVGRPRNMDGTLGVQAEKVSKFVSRLKKITKIPIIFEDETNTTNIVKGILIKEGLNPQKNKDLVNKKAAQLILKSYLENINKDKKDKYE